MILGDGATPKRPEKVIILSILHEYVMSIMKIVNPIIIDY